MSKLYPLTFKPIFKEKIWGGTKIKTFLNKDFSPLDHCGESWELSAVSGDESVIANGHLKGLTITKAIEKYKEELVGKHNYSRFRDEFPLLIKFIDAAKDLSVQVHPDDVFSKDLYGPDASGKSEIWYIMQADDGASLISGFTHKITKSEFKERLAQSRLEEVLNREEVKAGDVFYIPAGRIHTIGQGLLIAEIQQTSDVTYRIYDFDRLDATGQKRELHVDKAAEVLNFEVLEDYKTRYTDKENDPSQLVTTKHFTINKWNVDEKKTIDYAALDSFVVLIGIEGAVRITSNDYNFEMKRGDVYLLPACTQEVVMDAQSPSEFLEVTV